MTNATLVQAFCSQITSFVVPNVSAATTYTQAVTISTPNVSAATATPTITTSGTISPAPQNVAVATVAPTVTAVNSAPLWIETSAPDVAAVTVAPTISQTNAVTQPVLSTTTVTVVRPSVDVGSAPSPPDVAAGTISPTIREVDSLVQPVISTVTTTALKPTLSVAAQYSTPYIPILPTTAVSVLIPNAGAFSNINAGATIIAQELPCAATYQAANAQDYIELTYPTTFLYYYNSTASSVSLVVSTTELETINWSYDCYTVIIPANSEILIGPFDLTIYGQSLVSIATPSPSGLTVAAFYYIDTTPPALPPFATLNGIETQKQILLGVEEN